MQKNRTLFVAVLSGTVVSVAMAGPRDPQTGGMKQKATPTARQYQRIGPAAQQPRLVQWVGVQRTADGHLVPTGPFIQNHSGGADAPTQNGFDIFQSDAAGVPTGGVSCGLAGEAYRWFFGTTYINCNVTNDFQMDPAAVNKPIDRIDIGWNWGAAAAPRPMWILIEFYDTFNTCATGLPASAGFSSGVLLQFTDQAGGGGYFYTNFGMTGAPAAMTAPVDGNGAYHFAFGSYDTTTQVFTLDNIPGTQPMLWGKNSAGQLGVHGGNQWDDDGGAAGPQISNGTYAADECYDYTGAVACPGDPVGAMAAFWTEPGGGGCYANCDGSAGTPLLTANDFQCFINKYAANDPYANCDGSGGTPALTANDFQCFINKYAGGCS